MAFDRKNLYKSFENAPDVSPEQVAVALYNSAKSNAPSRGIPFNLAFESVYDKVLRGTCALTGVPFVHKKHTLLPWRASLDRLDNTKGYTEDNVDTVAKIVNGSKGAYSLTDFDKMCIERVRELGLIERD